MEDWNESICQFHRLFGGKQQLSSSSSVEDDRNGIRYWNSPLQGEFSNVHKSDKSKILGIKHLHGFEDIADRVVYEAVKYKFKQMIGEQRCYKYMTWDDLKAERDNNNEAILQQYNIKFDNVNSYRDFISMRDINTALFKMINLKLINDYNICSGEKIYLPDIINHLNNKYKKNSSKKKL